MGRPKQHMISLGLSHVFQFLHACPASSGEMFLPKLPNPSRPWRPCLLPGAPPTRPHPRRRIPTTTLPGRQHFLPPSAASASGSPPSRNSPLPPARTSSKNKSPDEIGRWKKVPPGMREFAVHETEDPSPPRTALWSARRRAHAACRKVASWLPRKTRSVVLINLVTLIFGTVALVPAFLRRPFCLCLHIICSMLCLWGENGELGLVVRC